MKYIKLFESFNNDTDIWPLLGVHRYYDYSGPIKGEDILENSFKGLIEKNAFLKAWFSDYLKASYGSENDFEDTYPDGDYDMFKDNEYFWGHTDENIYLESGELIFSDEGIIDLTYQDLYCIIMAEVCNSILLSDPDYRKGNISNYYIKGEISSYEDTLGNEVENLFDLIDLKKIGEGVKKARKKSIQNLIDKGHSDWKGMRVDDLIEELKNDPDFPPYKTHTPNEYTWGRETYKPNGVVRWDTTVNPDWKDD